MHPWHNIFYHATPTAIKHTLKIHAHPDDGCVSTEPMTFMVYIKSKLPRAPHRRVERTSPVGQVMFTDVGGPIYPTGPNQEKYNATFIDVGSRYAFVIPIQRKSQVLQAMIAAIQYVKNTRLEVPILIQSYNPREYVAVDTSEVARQFGVATRTTVPCNQK